MNTVAEKRERTSNGNAVAELPFAAPDVNIYETEQGFVLQAEMPGVMKNGLEVTLEGNALTFVGPAAMSRCAARRSTENPEP